MLNEKWSRGIATLKSRFVHNTLNFLFIIVFINVFQAVFGPENSILAVALTILMPASTVRDMTATPVKHLCIQALVLELMVCSAFLVQTLSPWAALPVNLAALLVILYAYTYENASHMYFPYILSYLFFLFISPVTAAQMPRRMLAALAGAACTILYQLHSNRHRVVETSHDRLTALVEQALRAVRAKLDGGGAPPDLAVVRESVCTLSRLVYERRRKTLRLSDASCALLDAGRTLEHLCLLIAALPDALSPVQAAFLRGLIPWLEACRDYVQHHSGPLPAPDWPEQARALTGGLPAAVEYLRSCLTHMAQPEKRRTCRKTGLSLWTRVKAAMDVSTVRVAYAVRVAVLLAVGTMLVQLLGVTHGKWILFTVASLSLPYADDIAPKTKKRIAGTLVGGAISVALYSLISDSGLRTFFMMLSGYCNGFFSDYAQTYTCATVGALGGAVFLNTFGWGPVAAMFGLRVLYILLGAGIAFVFNRLLLPFTRERATQQLTSKYVRLSGLLSSICRKPDADPQLYYSLVVQTHMTEQRLFQNARTDGGQAGLLPVVAQCRRRVREAHMAAPA